MKLSRLFAAVLVTALLGLNVAPAHAQPKKTVRIGVLAQSHAYFLSPQFAAFRQGLQDLGYIEIKT
jgi:hypothetical protein